ncbi:MAG TPA: acyl-CoA carboxylase subunit epsilon [Streptosporangiaceae bacterium]|jgi:hypothetical protein|nr:acyl-CoA carboxylase subunit epsilon [Streptosporangiaceae bacterium]
MATAGSVLRIVSGQPDDAEIAAVTTVLAVRLAAEAEASQPAAGDPGSASWTAPDYRPPGSWTSR